MFNILVTYKSDRPVMGIFPYRKYSEIFVNEWANKISNQYKPMFNFSLLEKIKPGTKYVVYLSYYEHFVDEKFKYLYTFSRDGEQSFPVPKRVSRDSKKGLVHWIIDWGTECNQPDDSMGINFPELCKSLKTTPENITLITGAETQGTIGKVTRNYAKQNGYNVITGYKLHGFLQLENQTSQLYNYGNAKLTSINNLSILKYKSLCYNRLPRQHRTVIVAHIKKQNYNSACLYSLGTFPNGPRWHYINEFPELANQIEELIDGEDIYPHIAEHNVDLQQNQAETIGWEHGLNSYFQFVTETTPDTSRFPFITEKSLKPFAMMQPFIQFGPKDNVKNLKNYGYDIFEEWIDHSYDDEEDDIKRLRLVLKEFDRLQAIPNTRWAEMLKEMTPSLLHNFQLVNRPVARTICSQLIPVLNKFIES